MTSTGKPFGAYIRISQEGDRTKEEVEKTLAQYRKDVERVAASATVALVKPYVEETNVSGGKEVDSRELGALIARVERGELGGIIVPNSERFARDMIEGCIALKRITQAGGRFISGDGIDSNDASSTAFFQMRMLFAEDYLRRVSKQLRQSASASVTEDKIHSGSTPPLGYNWPKSVNKRTGKLSKSGPLVKTDDAERVTAFFNRCADVNAPAPTWREAVELLGVKSQGAAWNVLNNRVYLGEARGGGAVAEKAHPALVDEVTFLRAQRRMQKAPSAPRTKRAPGSLRGLLQCGTCGGSLTEDRSMKGWRCKRLSCTAKASITHTIIEPIMLDAARAHHAECYKMNPTTLDEIGISVFEDELAKAQSAVAELDEMHEAGELDAVTYAKAAAPARKEVESAVRALQAAESTTGWLSLAPEAVERRLADGDTETLGSFLREMVAAVVKSCGRNSKAAPVERVDVLTTHKPGWMYEAAGIENPALVG